MTEEKRDSLKRALKYRWLIWGILCLCYIVVFFQRLSVGVVRSDLEQTFNLSAFDFGNLISAYFYAYMIMQIPTGILADSLGPKITVTIGILLGGIGSILFGLSPNIQIAFISRLLVGAGVAVIYVCILKVISNWFYVNEFATMVGITSFIGNLGAITAQAPLLFLVSILSWRNTFILIGTISIVLGIITYIITSNSPEDKGWPSLNKQQTTEKINIKESFIKVCKNPYTWPPFVLFAGMYGAFVGLTGGWGMSYLKDVYKMNDIQSSNYITIALIGVAIGSIVMGKISDKLGRRKLPIIVFNLISLICWFVLVFGNIDRNLLLGIMFMIGFSTSSFVLSWPCGKEVNDPKVSGISTSIVNMGGSLGSAILPLAIGKVIDIYSITLSINQTYQKAFLIAIVFVTISLIASLFIKETNCKNVA
jgi:sugar phosphate permease